MLFIWIPFPWLFQEDGAALLSLNTIAEHSFIVNWLETNDQRRWEKYELHGSPYSQKLQFACILRECTCNLSSLPPLDRTSCSSGLPPFDRTSCWSGMTSLFSKAKLSEQIVCSQLLTTAVDNPAFLLHVPN